MLQRTALRVHSLSHKRREALGLRQKDFQPLILGVCGGSGSGKTTFCEQFVDLVGHDRVLHLKQDDYYRDLSSLTPEQRDAVNFDHPDSIEFSLLGMHLEYLMAGKDIAVPRYDFATHTRTSIQQVVSPKPVILVEGILLYANDEIASRIHHKVFIDASDAVRFQRRVRRDVRERGRTAEHVEWQFNSTVRPMHERFVEPKKQLADKIISGEEPFGPALLEVCALLMRDTQYRRYPGEL